MLTETEQRSKINDGIKQMTLDPDIQTIVKHIEAGIKTTQDNYGPYMQFLTNFTKDPICLYIMSRGLIGAGANAKGVQSAMRILKGGE